MVDRDIPLCASHKTFFVAPVTFDGANRPTSVAPITVSIVDKVLSESAKTFSVADKTLAVPDKRLCVTDKAFSVTDKPLSVTDKVISKLDKVKSKPHKVLSDWPLGNFHALTAPFACPKPRNPTPQPERIP